MSVHDPQWYVSDCHIGPHKEVFPIHSDSCVPEDLIVELPWAEKRVSTGAFRAVNDPLVVQTKILKHS